MPEVGGEFAPRSELLDFDQIFRFTQIAVPLGLTDIRLTGGEPLLRRSLPDLIARLSVLDGVRDLALTTNGVLLPKMARQLYDAGLRRLNVHIDTLDRERYRVITRRDDLHRVLAGIEAALEIGFTSVKLNAVALRGLTDADIIPLARFSRSVISKSASSNSCPSIPSSCGPAIRCCWPMKWWIRCPRNSDL